MTFRPSLATRWMFPALISSCIALLWWIAAMSGYRSHSEFDPVSLAGGLALVAALFLAFKSWQVWTTRVTLAEKWIEWKRGTEYGSIEWNNIAKLGYRHGMGGIRVGLVERDTDLLHPLPLMTRGLYKVLGERIGTLPADVEADLFG